MCNFAKFNKTVLKIKQEITFLWKIQHNKLTLRGISTHWNLKILFLILFYPIYTEIWKSYKIKINKWNDNKNEIYLFILFQTFNE